jgi:hypothetical protein
MIDSFCILVSTVMCLLVIYRAARLDRELPWFRAERPAPPPAEKPKSPGRARTPVAATAGITRAAAHRITRAAAPPRRPVRGVRRR